VSSVIALACIVVGLLIGLILGGIGGGVLFAIPGRFSAV